MNSDRIKALASFIEKDDIVLDVGCDHGYLALYLKLNNICREVYASDISKKALAAAQNNFLKYHVSIPSFVSDGFSNIPVYFDTPVIAGMGTTTILNIIANEINFKKIIIASNNELYKLRKNLNTKGFKIEEEKVIYEKRHYYVIMKVVKGKQELSERELLFGISNNKEYYQYLLDKNRKIINKVPLVKKEKLEKQNAMLKDLIERK